MRFEFDGKELESLATLLADKVIEKIKTLPKNPPNDNPNDNDSLLTVPELAKYLKVKESWIYQKVHVREIPFYKIGNKLRFKRSEIDKMLT